MAVYRVHKTRDYTVMSNHHLRDENLSLKAKGMLSMMLTLPDDWRYNISGLTSLIKEGKTTVRTTLRELREAGYVVVTKVKNENTGLFEYTYDIYETPVPPGQRVSTKDQINPDTGFPYLVTPQLVIPGLDNPDMDTETLLNKEIQSTEEQKKEIRKKGKPKQSSLDDAIAKRTSNPELVTALNEFVRMRSRIRKPLTDYALRLRLDKLWKLGSTDEERIAIVNQSIGASWQDFFPLKDGYGSSTGGNRDASDDKWSEANGW